MHEARTQATSPRIPLFLDCDPGIDDAIAIGYLVCQPDVSIVGVAASGGNVPTRQVVRNALDWLALAGRADIPVHPGSELPLAWLDGPGRTAAIEYAEVTHGPAGTGYAKLPRSGAPSDVSAAEAWVAAARQHPGELIGVVIGPSTNLALALRIEPRLPQLLRRLFIMGGAFNYRGNTRPTTEWNVTFDPEAAAQAIRAFGTSTILPVIAPIEATEAVVMTQERLAQITEAAAPAPWHTWTGSLEAALRFYLEFHERDGHGYLAHIHDPAVLAIAIEWARRDISVQHEHEHERRSDVPPVPWVETRTAPVDVELAGTLTRGETVADWLGRWGRDGNAEVIRRIDAPKVLAQLTETLSKGPQQ